MCRTGSLYGEDGKYTQYSHNLEISNKEAVYDY